MARASQLHAAAGSSAPAADKSRPSQPTGKSPAGQGGRQATRTSCAAPAEVLPFAAPQHARVEASVSTCSSMKWVRSLWTKGMRLSDLESVQTRLPLRCPRRAAVHPAQRGSQQTTHGGLRSFPTCYCRAWQAARPLCMLLVPLFLLFFKAPPGVRASTARR